MAEKWWYKQLRMIQYNLQMKDTPRMDPERIASETENMTFLGKWCRSVMKTGFVSLRDLILAS